MDVLLRSKVSAGIAIVGASAIVVSPISVTIPDMRAPAIHMSSLATALASTSQSLPTWAQVIETTFSNIAMLGTQVQGSPDPILQQIITNQLANVATISTALGGAFGGLVAGLTALPKAFLTATQQLAAGQFSDAVQTLFQGGLGLVLAPVISLLPVFNIPGQIAKNVSNVLTALPGILLSVGLAAISPIGGAVYAFGDAGQLVVDSLQAGDAVAAIRALINIPAAMTGAFLNGYPATSSSGILSPYAGSSFGSGLIASLLAARDTIAQALGAPVPPSSAAVVARSAAPSAEVATRPKGTSTEGSAGAGNGTGSAATDSAPSVAASHKTTVTSDGNTAVPGATTSPTAATGTGSETGPGAGSTAGRQGGEGAKKGQGVSARNASGSAKAGAHSGGAQ
ncbi:hypothetical protein [Mycolicibacterium sarraceniae]|uniref:PE-PGRS family protein n=1 Tax=Mycolicibacterium sarraceniae TaxID=1534348 RepID=A0A7I7SNC2_9MYCO|nr:hypothetical protein [Mycolicibacterium sarraceniae]BBY58248.1 hypothetical protein MSAR_13840 [Mycolicibacterium sarraceniae]